jgi:hypothetical protein
MALTPNQAKIINDMAEILYDFLPGSRPPRSDQSISFPGAACDVGLQGFWWGGSKQPAIAGLLSRTYEQRKGKFCDLIVAIVNKAIIYRNSSRSRNKNPITRQEIVSLNELIAKLEFKIPQLWDSEFLKSLDGKTAPSNITADRISIDYKALLGEFIGLTKLEPQKRGYAFETFLNNMFADFGLNPRKSFKLLGEQIDGSFDLEGELYLIEAKWQQKLSDNADLLTFYGKVDGKSSWTRGLFISYSGFSPDGLVAFRSGRATNLIAMDGQDLYAFLEKGIHFAEVLKKKKRWAGETGEIFKRVFELFP